MTTLTQLIQCLQVDGSASQIWTASKLAQNSETAGLIENLLAFNGVREIAPKTLGGNMSLVVEIPDKQQVLRIVDAAQERSPVGNSLMLQPDIDVGTVNGFRVQVFPKVTLLSDAIANGSITKKDALKAILEMVDEFQKQGLFFWDVRLPNLGVTKNGEMKLLDPGSVSLLSERYDGRIGNDTHTNDDKYQANISHLCKELGSWTPSLGERIGRVIV